MDRATEQLKGIFKLTSSCKLPIYTLTQKLVVSSFSFVLLPNLFVFHNIVWGKNISYVASTLVVVAKKTFILRLINVQLFISCSSSFWAFHSYASVLLLSRTATKQFTCFVTGTFNITVCVSNQTSLIGMDTNGLTN